MVFLTILFIENFFRSYKSDTRTVGGEWIVLNEAGVTECFART